MRKVTLRSVIWFGLWMLGIVAVAQTSVCPSIVETALDSIDNLCGEAGRNQACYGNVSIETQFKTDVTDTSFADVGDIVDVSAIQSMQLSPMDEANNKWGLAMMRLQANIPDTTPGQNVTFLLFGDVEITDASADFADADLTPMHAFYLKTGVGDAGCVEAPESGLVVQTPDGITDIAFNINGVDVAMGSTILFQAEQNADMRIQALEGSALMELDGEIHTAVAGTRLRVPIDENFRPTGPPPLPEAYDEDLINHIPYGHLERQIQPPPPLTGEQLAGVHELIGKGALPCGMDGLPACDKLPTGGLNQGPQCRQEGDGCAERLAPHEDKGIKPRELIGQCDTNVRACENQPLDGQPIDQPSSDNAQPANDQRRLTPPASDTSQPPTNATLPDRQQSNNGGNGESNNRPPRPGG